MKEAEKLKVSFCLDVQRFAKLHFVYGSFKILDFLIAWMKMIAIKAFSCL